MNFVNEVQTVGLFISLPIIVAVIIIVAVLVILLIISELVKFEFIISIFMDSKQHFVVKLSSLVMPFTPPFMAFSTVAIIIQSRLIIIIAIAKISIIIFV